MELYHDCDTDLAEALHASGEGKYFLLLILSCLNLVGKLETVLLGYLSHLDNRQGMLPEHLASVRACIIFKVAASGLVRKIGEAPATHNAVLFPKAPFQHYKCIS